MKSIKRGLLLLFLLLVLQSAAQDMVSTDLPNMHQLPTKELLCIFQDSEGYMWYGTEGGGLCRDDGYQVSVFRSDFNTPDVLESNSITSIAEDGEGKIWFGSKRGVYILDKKTYQISPLADKEVKGWVIRMLSTTSDGSIWVSTGRFLFRYNAQGERQSKYEVQWENRPKEVNCIYEDKLGVVWMVQWKGGLFRYDAQADTFIAYPCPQKRLFTCIVKDAVTPYYWLGAWGGGVVRFDPNEKDVNRMFVPQQAANSYANSDKRRAYGIAQDGVKRYLWVATADNLYAYEVAEGDTLRAVATSSFLSKDRKTLNGVLCDRLGNVWVTGYYPYAYSFVISFLPSELVSYPMDLVKKEWGVAAAPMDFFHENGYYWIRQRRMGFYAYNPQKEHLLIYENSNRSLSFFFEKSADCDGIFVAMSDSVVVLVQRDGERFTESRICAIPAVPHERIRALHDDGHGNLWIGTTYNLLRYNLKQKRLHEVCRDVGIVNSIASLSDGSIYFVTEAKGFWKVSNGGEASCRYSSKENYLVLAASPDQKIWVGTQQGNVYCYDPNADSFTPKTKDCGLTGDVIGNITTDEYGNIWMLTDQKIAIYNPEKRATSWLLCSDPSIPLDNFLSLHRGKKGEMHIGGRGGILVFPLNSLEEKTEEATISLTSCKINNVQKLLSGSSRKVVLSPKERNVELLFSSFNHLNVNKIRYSFRQKNGDDRSCLPVGQNSIYLANLSSGSREVEVQATDGNGLWSKGTTTITVQRLPAWYATWWAYALYLLVFLAAIFPVVARKLQRQRVVEKAEENSQPAASPQDEKLIKKVLELIESNLSNADYSIENLSNDMAMSRANLYRKISAITGLTPTDFVKSIRLKKAAELLKQGELTIAEIAYTVGFNTPGYFTKSFKKMYGVLPTQYNRQ